MMPAVSRRKFLAGAASIPLSRFAFGSESHDQPACTLVPEQETGPFYIAGELMRSDIRESKPGIPLTLSLTLLDQRTCRPLPFAAVDLWHCDASGLYSGFTKTVLGGPGGEGPGGPDGPPPGPPPDGMERGGDRHGPPGMQPSDKLTFCRGIQVTDSEGCVTFNTIVPGFYQGRVNHIHLKVRLGGHANGHTYAEGHTAHTGQIFFPEHLVVSAMSTAPYRSHHIHRTTAQEDGIFQSQGGSESLARLAPVSSPSAPWTAAITLSVNPAATPAPVGMRPPGMPGEGPGRRTPSQAQEFSALEREF